MPVKLTLYAVEERLQALLDSEDLVPVDHIAAFQAELAAAGTVARDKRDNVIRFIRYVEAQIEFARAEERRIADWRKRAEAGLERFGGYVVKCIESTGTKKLEGHTGALAIQQNPPSVQIGDVDALARDLCDITITMRLDQWDCVVDLAAGGDFEDPIEAVSFAGKITPRKAEIAKRLKAGEDVPGADLRFGAMRLEIK